MTVSRAGRALLALSVAALAACQPPEKPPAPAALPTPTPAPENPALEEADRFFAARQYEEASAAYAGAAELGRGSDDTALVWAGVLGRARADCARLRSADCLPAFETAWSAAGGDGAREAETAYRAAIASRDLGKLDAALAWAERSLPAAERAGDAPSLSMAYAALGNAHSYRGSYEEALTWNERRVALWREVEPTSTELARSLNNVGIDYRHFGRLAEARRIFDEALAIYRAHADANGMASVMHNLANVHWSTGDLQRTVELKNEALVLAEQTDNRFGIGMLNADLGQIYLQVGNLGSARSHLERALEIHREDRRVYGQTMALLGLARLELEERRPAEAQRLAEEARAEADAAGLGSQQTAVRNVLGRAALALGRHETALELARDALARAEALDDPEVELEAREVLGAALEAASSGEEAAAAYVSAVDLLDSWRGRLELGELRLGLGESHLAASEGAIRALLALGRAEQAFEIGERARARLLLEILADREEEREATDAIARVRSQLRERYDARRKLEGQAREALDATIGSLVQELERLEAQARAADPVGGASRHPRPTTARTVRETLAIPGRTLIAYFWGDHEVFGWRVDARGIVGTSLGSSRELAVQVEFTRDRLAERGEGPDHREAAAALFDKLVRPLLDAAPAQELLVIPDGALSLVPFEALAPDVAAEPLGITHSIRYGPSASVLVALAVANEPGPFERELLAVGVSRGGPSPAESSLRRVATVELPEAPVEARAVAACFRGRPCDVLVGRAATLDRWRAMRPERYRLLHFATHAEAAAGPAARAHLAFSDTVLDLPGIRDIRVDAALVTLSACDTARGPRVRGEGIVGLTHAFLAAGARGVVASLWQVEDRSTAEFMKVFYRHLAEGSPPAAALRETRSELFSAGAHPSAWAAFVLVGGS